MAHIGLRTDNLEAARKFYGQHLGYEEAFQLDKPEGGLMLVYFKVNDHQYIEVFPGWKGPEQLVLSHIAFETDDAPRLRDYLASKGVKVPDALRKGLDGNLSFMIKDPDGHDVEFVQYMPGSLHSRNFGKALPATRVSERIIHVGTTVSDQAAFDALYHDILGFREFWHGGMTDERTDWIDMRVPDGTDWFEYMLNVKNPTRADTRRDEPHGAGSAECPGRLQDRDGARLESGSGTEGRHGTASGSSTFTTPT